MVNYALSLRIFDKLCIYLLTQSMIVILILTFWTRFLQSQFLSGDPFKKKSSKIPLVSVTTYQLLGLTRFQGKFLSRLLMVMFV